METAHDFLIRPYIRERGITLLGGYPGTGTTWLALLLAIKISQGQTFHSNESTQPRNVFYIHSGDEIQNETFKEQLQCTFKLCFQKYEDYHGYFYNPYPSENQYVPGAWFQTYPQITGAYPGQSLAATHPKAHYKNFYWAFQNINFHSENYKTDIFDQIFNAGKYPQGPHLLVFDGVSLSNELCDKDLIGELSLWLLKLQDKGITVLLIPHRNMMKESSMKTIEKLPFTDILWLEKEDALKNSGLSFSVHFQKVPKVEEDDLKPIIVDLDLNTSAPTFRISRQREDKLKLKEDIAKRIKRKYTNKEIADELCLSEPMVKKLRREFGLSKTQKNTQLEASVNGNKIYVKKDKTTCTFDAEKMSFDNIERQILKANKYNPYEFDDIITTMYLDGNFPQIIQSYIFDNYRVGISDSTIKHVITVVNDIRAWKISPLKPTYPILFFDRSVVKIRIGNSYDDKLAYWALGINESGGKELLGMWVSYEDNGVVFQNACGELKSRGVRNIYIVNYDNYHGSKTYFQAAFPMAKIQTSVTHLINWSLKSTHSADSKTINKHLKEIYIAESFSEAEERLKEFEIRFIHKYPTIVNIWKNGLSLLRDYFSYPQELRKILYGEKSIEMIQKLFKKNQMGRIGFPNEFCVEKLFYCALLQNTQKWNPSVPKWEIVKNQLTVIFPDFL